MAFRSISAKDFQDPFVENTIDRILGDDTAIFFPKDAFASYAILGAAPVGIIFHVARCGSTLITQLLKSVEAATIYSEPPVVNDVLMPPHEWSEHETVAALRLLGALFSAHAGGPYVWKMRSWNTLFCGLVAQAFPDTPWIFCVRDPVEVAISVFDKPPTWLRALGSAKNQFLQYLGIEAQSPTSREEYVAKAYSAFCRSIGQLNWQRGKLIHYENLPGDIWNTVGGHFGLAIGDVERRRMMTAARLYSKAAQGEQLKFFSDTARKRARASPELVRAMDLYARPALQDLYSTMRLNHP